MSYQDQVYSWIFSSNPALGAQAVSADGSTFSTFLQEPFQLPKNAFGIELGCISASVVYNQFNVTEANNRFIFEGVGVPIGLNTLLIPVGLYSFDELNRTLRNLLLFSFNVTNYTLVGVQATQRVSEVFQVTPSPQITRVHWPLGTFGNLLGYFPTRVTSNPASTAGVYPGDETAAFNQIDFYLIQTSLLSRGIRTNNTFRGVIAQVPITDVPGSLISFQPQNIQWTAAPELGGGATVTSVQTILCDSNGQPLPTYGEPWSVTLQIRWKIPLY